MNEVVFDSYMEGDYETNVYFDDSFSVNTFVV
jgi:hypothetical protein